MKKIIALLLTLALTVTVLAACGSSGSSTTAGTTAAPDTQTTASGGETTTADAAATGGSSEETENLGYKIGFISVAAVGSLFGNCYGSMGMVADGTGIELVSDIGAVSPEDQITSVKNVISAGADAIVFINFTEDCLTKIADVCDEAGVYWGQFCRDVNTDSVKEYLANSEHYVGRIYNNEEFVAKSALENFQAEGVTKVAIVGPATGDVTTDTRDNYFQEHAAEYGIEVVADVRDLVDAATATDAVSNIVATHADLEGIFCISSSDSRGEGVVNAIDTLGMNGKLKVFMCDFFEGMESYLEDGTIIGATGGQYPDALFLMLLLINQLHGDSLSADGSPLALELPYLVVHSADELNEYVELCESGNGYSYNLEECKELIKAYNPDLTLEQFKAVMDAFSIEDILARKGK